MGREPQSTNDAQEKSRADAAKARSHMEDRLDEALKESFPASDPTAVHEIQTTPPRPKPEREW